MVVKHLIPLLPTLFRPNLPFEAARLQWLPLFDTVLEALESPGGLQTATLSDNTSLECYLQLRPERYEQIEGLIAKGKLRLSTWYRQPDETTLPHPEVTNHNLSLGLAIAAAFGQKPTSALLTVQTLSIQLADLFSQAGILGILFTTQSDSAVSLRNSEKKFVVSYAKSDQELISDSAHIATLQPIDNLESISALVQAGRQPNTLQSTLENYFNALSYQQNLPEWLPSSQADFTELPLSFTRLLSLETAFLQHKSTLPNPEEVLKYAWRMAFTNRADEILSALESTLEPMSK